MQSEGAKTEKGDPMEVETGTNNADVGSSVSPEDPKFVESLTPELRGIAVSTLQESEDASTRLENLEVHLRKLTLGRIRDSAVDLGQFWTLSLRLCLHLVSMSEETTEDKYKGLNARKIPFVVLEDIFDCLSVDRSLSFWRDNVLGAYEIIFGQRIWSPSPTQHPCWLLFLRITNKLIRRLPPKESAQIMLTLCRVYPLSEKSAARPFGSHNVDNITSFEESEEFEEEQARIPAEIKMTDEEGSVADYNFYESFWKLQEDLNNPNKLDVTKFLPRLRSVVTALENHKVSSQTPKPATRTMKYLTSSHLLSYQLRDAEFRIHILTQILIVCHHLLSQAGPNVREKIAEWKNRTTALLKNMGDTGQKHLATLESVLDGSEKGWRQWKKDKLKEDLDKRKSEPLTSRKRRRTLGGALGAATGEDEASQALTQGIMNVSELATASKQMRGLLPSLDSHMADYVEALDPEAGIEAEYHPRNDKLFSWRTLRMMSREHLAGLQRVHANGDFEGLVRHVYQERDTAIPGDFPQYEIEDFEEKDEVPAAMVEEDDGKAEAEPSTNDETMTDASREAAGATTQETVLETVGDASNKDKPNDEASTKENGTSIMEVDEENGDGEESDARVEKANGTDTASKESDEKEKMEDAAPKDMAPKEEATKQAAAQDQAPPPTVQEKPRLDFTPPPGRDNPKDSDTQTKQPPPENGQRRRSEDAVDPSGGGGRGGRRNRGGPGRGEPRGRGDRGRDQPGRNERGPPLTRDERPPGGRSSSGRDDRRSPPVRDERGLLPGRGDRGPPPGKGDRGSPPRRGEDRGPAPRRDDYRGPPPGRGRDDQRPGGGGRGGGNRGDDRGPPPERWENQRGRRARDDLGDERRDMDDRRGPRRRGHR